MVDPVLLTVVILSLAMNGVSLVILQKIRRLQLLGHNLSLILFTVVVLVNMVNALLVFTSLPLPGRLLVFVGNNVVFMLGFLSLYRALRSVLKR